MSDTAANPETGATEPAPPAGPFATQRDLADALGSVLGPDDYPDGEPDEPGAEQEAEPQETEADNSQEPEAAEGEESEEIELEEAEEHQPRTYRVKVNGEEQSVTFDELKAGYSRQQDYTAKTQALAEEKRQIDSLRQRYEAQLDQAIPALQSVIQGKFANIDWVQLAQEDPAEYTSLRAEFDQHNQAFQQAMAEKQYLESQRKEEQKAEMQKAVEDGRKRLIEMHPVFGDAEKGPQVATDLRRFLGNTGYTDDDIRSVTDPRAMSIAYKAMLYDQAQARAKKAKADSAQKAVPKVQKAGTPVKEDSDGEIRRQLSDRVLKSGKVEDLADWLSTQDFGSLD